MSELRAAAERLMQPDEAWWAGTLYGLAQKLAANYLAEHPADDGEPVKPLTRERIERAVEGLFAGQASSATRTGDTLVIMDSKDKRRDLGGWPREAVVAHLCRELGVNQ